MRQPKTPTLEEIRRNLEETRRQIQIESLPSRREYLQTLTERRGVLLHEMTETETLLHSTLLFETEEESLLLDSLKALKESLSKLDSCLCLLEENIRRVEEGGEI